MGKNNLTWLKGYYKLNKGQKKGKTGVLRNTAPAIICHGMQLDQLNGLHVLSNNKHHLFQK